MKSAFQFVKGEKKQMKSRKSDLQSPTFWQLVFLQSKVNGATYGGEQLPRRNWSWPKDTYLQQRLRRAKFYLVPDKDQWN